MAESVLSSGKMGSSLQQSISSAKALFQGRTFCYQLGLFKLGFDVPSLMSYSFPMDIGSVDFFITATSGLLIIGVICMLIGMIYVAKSAFIQCESVYNKSSARKSHQIGRIVIAVGASLLLSGMLTYTINQARTVHNPIRFFSEIETVSQKIFSQMLSGSTAPSNVDLSSYGIQGRKKRDALYSQEPGSLGLSPDSMQDLQSKAKEMLQGVDPVFGYSFYLAWFAVVMALIAVISGQLASISMADNVDAGHGPLV
ncbi:unnamed protein product [Clavelina lepadiformis]|uniref:Uncharacterized protein n=1 Tax=Clavelina lepadiformis TaxID=159417 RepID=A0ABP0H2H9_CLALP